MSETGSGTRGGTHQRRLSRESPDRRPLAGRVALVTGAGRNIGRAIALALAADGAAVAVNARANRDEAEAVVRAIEAAGGEGLALLADVSDRQAVRALVAAALGRFGRLDILVNNAALRRESPVDAVTADEWRNVLATTLDAAFHCAQACIPALRASGAGTIVNIGGLTAYTGATHRAHVVAAKAGIGGLTRALAHELAPDNVTVNCVSPGLIDTVRGGSAAPAPAHHRTAVNALGRRGSVDEVASAVCFLCGPGARYITGQTLHVNGGAWMG